MPTRILLSVKPRFAEAILDGTKTFEFRRALFRRRDIDTVVLYASSPTCKILGEFTIEDVLSLEVEELWTATRHGGAIDRAYFDNYFVGCSDGHAIKIGKACRYKTPLCLRADLGISTPPQSFRYVKQWDSGCRPTRHEG